MLRACVNADQYMGIRDWDGVDTSSLTSVPKPITGILWCDEHVHSLIGWCISHIACRMDVQSVYASVVNFLNLNNMQDWIAQNEHPWTLSVVLQHICFMIWKCLLCLFRVWVICSVRKFIYWDGYWHKVVPEPFNYWFSVFRLWSLKISNLLFANYNCLAYFWWLEIVVVICRSQPEKSLYILCSLWIPSVFWHCWLGDKKPGIWPASDSFLEAFEGLGLT